MTPPSSSQKRQAGQYYLMEKIAQGGMAEIFKGLAYDVHGLKRTICIKKILPHIAASEEFIHSLIDEAKIAVTLNHGNIAQTYDLGKVEDDYFIVMEYVDGKSLSQLAKRSAARGKLLPLPIVCSILAEIANGLDYMHRRTDEKGEPLHIVHRDISPQNIVVSYSGTVKIIDFGIAVAVRKTGIMDAGILKGKFSYMSPEQARGETIDRRSDIFSLGIILYELLTGKRLFKAEDNRQTIRNVRRARVAPPSTTNPDIPDEIDAICTKALAKDRRRRFAFASEMRDALNKFQHIAYPEFKTSDVADFVLELFRDELQKREQVNEEAQTPHLIIPGTNSALIEGEQEPTGIASAPIDLNDYLLEDSDDEEEPSPPEAEKEDEERTVATTSFSRSKLIRSLLPLGIVLLLLGAGLWFLNRPTPQPSPLLETPTTSTEKHTSQIFIESSPAGATIFLDNRQTGLNTPFTLEKISPGKHILGLFLLNHKFWEKEVDLKTDETLHLDIHLIKILGSLVITSQPGKARVLMNGIPVGVTPLTLRDLEPELIYQLNIMHEGYKPLSREVKIRPGRTEEVRVTLEQQKTLE